MHAHTHKHLHGDNHDLANKQKESICTNVYALQDNEIYSRSAHWYHVMHRNHLLCLHSARAWVLKSQCRTMPEWWLRKACANGLCDECPLRPHYDQIRASWLHNLLKFLYSTQPDFLCHSRTLGESLNSRVDAHSVCLFTEAVNLCMTSSKYDK